MNTQTDCDMDEIYVLAFWDSAVQWALSTMAKSSTKQFYCIQTLTG